MAEAALLAYGVLATLGFTFLLGLAVGFWLGTRDRKTPTPARRGRHSRQESPDE